ncbi:hypothetical protein HBA55_34855 [Pseudomaricurvus alkylphenolicus]|uniref:hypothetical protein n=1 Tax=Pseudomaricurvus alkylphenolicus TaxID=1306991 RepID=UPI001420162B|nr:hypothetical protein [Pseudomaricurvus alkylphenolicus]NIB44813.1 hypothetical protein [Pseudomaricurvus alkylphenolicus]
MANRGGRYVVRDGEKIPVNDGDSIELPSDSESVGFDEEPEIETEAIEDISDAVS